MEPSRILFTHFVTLWHVPVHPKIRYSKRAGVLTALQALKTQFKHTKKDKCSSEWFGTTNAILAYSRLKCFTSTLELSSKSSPVEHKFHALMSLKTPHWEVLRHHPSPLQPYPKYGENGEPYWVNSSLLKQVLLYIQPCIHECLSTFLLKAEP